MKKFKVALQLFSIRDEMKRDMDTALGEVKKMGYDYVEFAGYFGKSAEEVRALLDKHRLECVSVHQGLTFSDEELQKTADFLKVIGSKYCAIPGYSLEEFKNNFNETAALFAKAGKILKDNGISLLYHNHANDFEKLDGEYILDKLFATVPADLLNPQIDTCWVHYAGENPAAYIEKYAGRISVVHLKDFVCKKFGEGPVYDLIGKGEIKIASRDDAGFAFRPVGYGIQDFPAILSAAGRSGADVVVVEDECFDPRPMESVKMSRDYLKSLGL
jgi:sugar phosphate isomerase/epimerase